MAPSPAPRGSAAYKKKDGSLVMSQDRQSISWIPAAGGSAGMMTIPVANITNLQQTPATNPKVMLRVFAQPADSPASAPEQYVFSFTGGANARSEADAIKDALSTAIQAAKAMQTGQTTIAAAAAAAGGGGKDGGVSAAMAMASAVSYAAGKPSWEDDQRLKTNVDLQQSLLKSDAGLQRIFMETLRNKPETLSAPQFIAQFWSTRLHLLRAHAIEKAQTRGSYNVLSSLKPRVEDNVTKLNISKEQIQLIFTQHPLVKRVYDENVPKLSEQQFWSRFFQSRLFKKLRGERISDHDATDAILDKYLKSDERLERLGRALPPTAATATADDTPIASVPHFIDLAGNEVDHSQRQGNRPDVDMRPSALENVPIIRVLNNLSENIMAGVAPADRDFSAQESASVPSSRRPAEDEQTIREVQLRDLQGDAEQQRVQLNIRDQSRFFAQGRCADDADESQSRPPGLLQDPEIVLRRLRKDLHRNLLDDGSAQLGKLVEPDEDVEDEDLAKTGRQSEYAKQPGTQADLQRASAQILSAIRAHRAQTEKVSLGSDGKCGLSAGIYDRLTLTHATTTEFLHQFWQAFLSGNPDRAAEVAALVESLGRARERIQAVATDAEAERRVEGDKLKRHARDVLEATGKRIRLNLAALPGGEKVVFQLLGPTTSAIDLALTRYQEALAGEAAEQQQPY